MLLDGSGSRGTAVLVDFGAKGHKGLHRLKSWRPRGAHVQDIDAVEHEPRSAASGNITRPACYPP